MFDENVDLEFSLIILLHKLAPTNILLSKSNYV